MRKLLHRFAAAGGVHDAHHDELPSRRRPRRRAPSGRAAARWTPSSPRSAPRTSRRWAPTGATRTAPIRDSKRISRDELEKRELLLMCYFSHDSYTRPERRARGRAASAKMTVRAHEGNSRAHHGLLAAQARRTRWYVRSGERGARAGSLLEEVGAVVEPSQLGELDEHAGRGARVEERDTFPFGAEPGRLVDQPKAGGAAAREGTVEVVDGEADVMDAGAAFGDELADGRVRILGLEQLDERVTGREAGDAGTVGVVERRLRGGRAGRGRRAGSRRARARRCPRGRCAWRGGERRSCQCAGEERRRR